jgi:uncharacterized membrane protein
MVMQMMDMMGLGMLFGVLLFAVVVAGAVYVAVRAALPRQPEDPDPGELLRRRLAAGEITAEEYYERESVLRESETDQRRRR